MKTTLAVALTVLMGMAGMASADSAPPVLTELGSNGIVFTLCTVAAGATPGDCVDTNGDEVVLDTGAFSSIVIDFSASGATTIACDLIGNNLGHDANSGVGQDLTATQFSTTVLAQTLPLTPRFVWVNCTTISGAADTISVTAFGRRE